MFRNLRVSAEWMVRLLIGCGTIVGLMGYYLGKQLFPSVLYTKLLVKKHHRNMPAAILLLIEKPCLTLNS